MKVITATIERNEDSYFAYISDIAGCVAGGNSYVEVKSNLELNLKIFADNDQELKKQIAKGYRLEFEVDLETVFDLLPEINITQLAKIGKLNSGLLRQYVSGSKKASEKQTEKVMKAIKSLSAKLDAICIVA